MKIHFAGLGKAARPVIGLAMVLTALAGMAHAGGPIGAPEIDPGSMGTALTLLFGGAMLFNRRLRKS